MSKYSGLNSDQLCEAFTAAKTDAERREIKETLQALTASAVQAAAAKSTPTVDWNASGGVYIQEAGKNSISAKGNEYAASVNLPVSMARLLLGDSKESQAIRAQVMALIAQPEDIRQKRIAEKVANKAKRESKEYIQERKVIEKMVKAGKLPESALTEFDVASGALPSTAA